MYQVINWIEEYALAESRTTLVEGAELDKRVSALRTLQRGWHNMNAREFTEAMSVGHFQSYFADALDRKFYKDYSYMGGAWKNYTTPDTAQDFRDVKRFRMQEPETLMSRRELEQHKDTYVKETPLQYGVEEFSRGFEVSWRTILNDDLSKIAETPERMARAASRFEDTFVNQLYHNTTTQAALIALGPNYAINNAFSKDALKFAVGAMMNRFDVLGNPIEVGGVSIVCGPTLLPDVTEVLENRLEYGNSGSDSSVVGGTIGAANNLLKYVTNVYVDPYIRSATAPGADVDNPIPFISQPWYLFANPSTIPAVTVARLRNVPGPFTFRKASDIILLGGNAPAAFLAGGAQSGSQEYFVETIIGGWDSPTYGGVTDYQGIFYSSGADVAFP